MELNKQQFGFSNGAAPKRTEVQNKHHDHYSSKIPSSNFGFTAPDKLGRKRENGVVKNTPTLYEGRRRKNGS